VSTNLPPATDAAGTVFDEAARQYLDVLTEWAGRRKQRGPEPVRRSIVFSEFRQVVRRFRPTDLLPALAALAVQIGDPPYSLVHLNSAAPWAIATAARESILYGNEHRAAGVTADDLRVLFNSHNNIYEPEPRPDAIGVLAILTRIAYEQFPYQESIFEEITRTHALLVDGADTPGLEVLGAPAGEAIFDASLGQVVGATFFLHVAAYSNAGWFDPQWLERADLQSVFDRWPRALILQRLEQLSYTFEEFREEYEAQPHPPAGFERYAYNPLTARPFIRMPDGRLLAPQPKLILRTVSPGSLYYRGIKTHGTAFSRDLGKLTERYVGEQLRSITPSPEVYPEIVYGKQNAKSIDWFLVLPGVVVMFEVKSARFGLLERAAVVDFERRTQELLGKAVRQLRATATALDSGERGFEQIPTDRPCVGIIVTAEPHYLANSPWARTGVELPPFPTLVASLREVEQLSCLPLEVIEEQLVRITKDPDRSTWSLGTALNATEPIRRNPILDRAWAAYPWPDGVGHSRE
jgi:hypothetical protein